MAGGTITFTTANIYTEGRIVWTATADAATNKSTVTCTLYLKKDATSGNATSGTLGTSLFINGAEFPDVQIIDLYGNTWVTIVSGTATVTHNADGTKSIPIFAEITNGVSSLSSFNLSTVTITLDTIPKCCINVGDSWKTIDWSGCAINTGDAWRTIDEVFINVEDGWKKVI